MLMPCSYPHNIILYHTAVSHIGGVCVWHLRPFGFGILLRFGALGERKRGPGGPQLLQLRTAVSVTITQENQ